MRRWAVAALLVSAPLRADDAMPPWTDAADVPVPAGVRSVAPTKPESAIYSEPGRLESRRGSAQPGARLPLFATRRAAGCLGRWLNVGPLAWMCSDVAEYSVDPPVAPALGSRPWDAWIRAARAGARGLPPIDPDAPTDDGLPFRYYFAGQEGAYGFANLESAKDDAADQELEPGFAVAILEERSAHGERWGRTKKGRWVALRELVPARANLFHGDLVTTLDLAWVVADQASTYGSEKTDKPTGKRVRFEKVSVLEEKGTAVRIGEGTWMRSKDLARPKAAPPPAEVSGEDRWIDVDLTQQALVAYEGAKPVFATIVSTGKGPPGSEFATHPGTFRIWVKVFTTKMDNLDKDEVDRHYAIEDVPWVQFFDKAIALHGAFWHRDFGRVHSHGCVNLAPLDARWLFAFTAPHLPRGWTAVLPFKAEPGTVVRVR
jgi:lipoprotein-anchoring transpeptidase ErfK/SrfK